MLFFFLIRLSEQNPLNILGEREANLKEVIEKSNRELNKTSLELRSERNKYEARAETPPKQDCKIM